MVTVAKQDGSQQRNKIVEVQQETRAEETQDVDNSEITSTDGGQIAEGLDVNFILNDMVNN